MTFFRASCRQGFPPACVTLTQLSCDPAKTQSDKSLARNVLQSSCRTNQKHACTALGQLLIQKTARAPDDVREGIHLLEKNCDRDPRRACGLLAEQYLDTPGHPHTSTEGMVLAELGCTAGDGRACWLLARAYVEMAKSDEEVAQAQDPLALACLMGEVHACPLLAQLYWLGCGLPRDAVRAASLFERGCNADLASGCTGLYEVLRADANNDDPRIPEILTAACDRGVGRACRALADLMLVTARQPPSFSRVADRWNRGCTLGEPVACARLALLTHLGLGDTRPDTRRAARLLATACQRDFALACDPDAFWAQYAGEPDQAKSGGQPPADADHDTPQEDRVTFQVDQLLAIAPPQTQLLTDSRDPGQCRRSLDVLGSASPDPDTPPKLPQEFHAQACALQRSEHCAFLGYGPALLAAEARCEEGGLADCLFVAEHDLKPKDPESWNRAGVFFEKACELSHGASCERVGWRLYLNGGPGTPTRKRGLQLLRRACELSVSSACEKLKDLGVPP